MLLARAAAAAAVALVAPGCGPPPACDLAAGPDGARPALEMVYVTRDGELRDVVDDAAVPLVAAPQGGHIVLLGVRIRGVTACSVEVTAAVRDPCNGRVVGLEGRPIELRDRGDGWAVPVDPFGISNFANVAVCPNEAAAHDIDGHRLVAEIRVADGAGGVLGERSAVVVPTCETGSAYCRCDCDLDGGASCETLEPDAATACPTPDAAPPDAS